VEEEDRTEFDDWAVEIKNDLHDWWEDKYSRPYSPLPRRGRFESMDPDPRMILCQDCCPLLEEHR